MKIYYALISGLVFVMVWMTPASAAPVSSEQRISELANRLKAFESNWNRFQIGGDLTLKSSTSLFKSPQNLRPLNFDQQLGLYLDTFMERNLSMSVKLTHFGEWGSKYYNQTYGINQMAAPLQLDEAFLRMQYPTSLNYLGRFRFSLSPLGLISDFYTTPVEGVSVQKTFRQFHAILLYSRINTQFQVENNNVKSIETEDYWAGRAGWSNGKQIIGLNIVPNGITGEKSLSLDWSWQLKNQKLVVEAAWYTFQIPSSSNISNANPVQDPGILVSYGITTPKNGYLQFKGGYFGNNFKPSYSSLSDTSGDDREWFSSNSYGLEISTQKQLATSWSWENRLLFLKPVYHYSDSSDGYHLSCKITKSFSPINQLQLAVVYKNINSYTDNSIYGSWVLRF